jgi:hypothetical protein
MKVGNFFHTFGSVKGWRAKGGTASDNYYFVLDRGSKGPNCVLKNVDKQALQACHAELWQAAKEGGDDESRLLPLTEAAPILFSYAKKNARHIAGASLACHLALHGSMSLLARSEPGLGIYASQMRASSAQNESAGALAIRSSVAATISKRLATSKALFRKSDYGSRLTADQAAKR